MGRCDGCDTTREYGIIYTNCSGTLVDINPIRNIHEWIANYLPTFFEFFDSSESDSEFFDCVELFDSSESNMYTSNPKPNSHGEFVDAIESSANSQARLYKNVNNNVFSLYRNSSDATLEFIRGSPTTKYDSIILPQDSFKLGRVDFNLMTAP